MTIEENSSLLQKLWDRRILQFTFSYVIGAFAVVQLIDWLSKRYVFSPVWTDIIFVFLAALLPSVLLFTYFHGQGNLKELNPTVKKFIPANMILAASLIFFLFNGSELGATASKVTVVTEEGEEIERFVPSSSQTKRLVLFPLEDNGFKDGKANTLAVYHPVLQDADLGQDNRLFSFNTYDLAYEYEQKGYQFGQNLPLSVYLKIARDYLSDYFMTGKFKEGNGVFSIDIKVYSTNDGKEFFSKSYESQNYFSIIDDISVDFRNALYLKEADAPSALMADLPASNLYTPNLEALNLYFNGHQHINNNQLEEGIATLKEAIKLDPNFAEGYKSLGIQQYRNQQRDEGNKSLARAVSLSNTNGLPERQQFNIRYQYYNAQDDEVEKVFSLLKMWNQLYPNDYIPYYRLYLKYNKRREFKEAETYALKALEAGHIARSLPRLASICMKQGRYEEAEKYLQRFEKEYPHKAKVNNDMGRLHQEMGNLDKALEYFEAIQLLKPDDAYAIGNVAFVHTNLGNFEEAEKGYLEALSNARLPLDSSNVLQWLSYFYATFGQMDKYEETLMKCMEVRASYRPLAEAMSMITWYDHVTLFVQNGEADRYKVMMDDYADKHLEGQDQVKCINLLSYSIAIKDKEASNKYATECGDFFGKVAGQHFIHLFNGLMAEMDEDYPKMVEELQLFLSKTGSKEDFWYEELARALRKNGDLAEAYEVLRMPLKRSPNSPAFRYQVALICIEQGKTAEAIEHLQVATRLWNKADPTFIPAKEAKALLAKITADS